MADDLAPGNLVWVEHATPSKADVVDAKVIGVSGAEVELELVEGGEYVRIARSKVRPMHVSSQRGEADMTHLADLSEGSLLRNLRLRYNKDEIYTYTGSILVAVNPYKPIPIYGQDVVTRYSQERLGVLPPHIFAIANDAYQSLVEDPRQARAILISGESGAGKTESTKLILNHLTHLSGAHSHVEQLLVESSPILEAFGNARTSINDNSSRFGKYMEVFFTPEGKIIGGRITEYLLEKSRIITQPKGDRNYHIFYQLLHGAPEALRAELKLKAPKDYLYLSQSNLTAVKPADDAKSFKSVTAAMTVNGFGVEEQREIFRILAAVLSLGNLQFGQDDKEFTVIKNKGEIDLIAGLLSLPSSALEHAMTHQLIKTGKEAISKPNTVANAEFTRDTLAKTLYVRLFRHIVASINSALALRKSRLEEDDEYGESGETREPPSVGVLDIFGFEVVANNGFEQFCINLANETLQAYFNEHIFKMEQEEYQREGITWERIAYTDNEQCLQLLYKGKLSLLPLLDEESSFPSATDDTLLHKFNENHASNQAFEKPQGKTQMFSISHYAGRVSYSVKNFLEKNQDLLTDSLLSLFTACTSEFITGWFARDHDAVAARGTLRRGTRPSTVSGQFRDSLGQLMKKLEASDPYFVRCLKPNANKAPSSYDAHLVLLQLRYTGMLETIRIRSLGYALRQKFADFYGRYFMLHRGEDLGPRERCAAILAQLQLPSHEYQVGRTMVFVRLHASRQLEDRRLAILADAARKLTNYLRMVVARRAFLATRRAIVRIQAVVRGAEARLRYDYTRACILDIQRVYRGHTARVRYHEIRKAIPRVVAAFRQKVCRAILLERKLKFDELKEQQALERAREEATARAAAEEQRRKEEEMRFKKQQELAENPGFKVIGLAQELQAAGQAGEIFDTEQAFAFSKYVSTYFREGATMSHSSTPLHNPLLAKLTPLEETVAATLSNFVRSFMASFENGRFEEARHTASLMFDSVSNSQKLIDELLCLVVKQTNHNPAKLNALAGWHLLALLLPVLPPSDSLRNYLRSYIVSRGPDGYASFCETLLLDGSKSGRRRCPPSNMEHAATRERKPASLLVHVYGDGEPVSITANGATRVDEVVAEVAKALGIANHAGYGIRLNGTVVGESEHLFDAVQRAERGGATSIRLQFRREHLHPTTDREDEAGNAYIMAQIRSEMLADSVEISIKDALTLVVLRLLLSGARIDRLADVNLKSEIPASLYERHEKQAMIGDMRECFETLAAEHYSEQALRRRYVAVAEDWPLYFGHIFACKQTDGTPLSKATNELTTLVNVRGLHAYRLSEAGHRVLVDTIDYNSFTELSNVDDDPTRLRIAVAGGRAIVFECAGAATMRTLMEDYMVHLKQAAEHCVAISDHLTTDASLLRFSKGSVIRVIRDADTSDTWCRGELDGETGLFPWNRVCGLVGHVPPPSKEAIAFQVLLRAEAPLSVKDLLAALELQRSRERTDSALTDGSSPRMSFDSFTDSPSSPMTTGGSSANSSLASPSAASPQQPQRPLLGTIEEEGKYVRSGAILLDERFHFFEYARQHFMPVKRSKGTLTSRLLSRTGTLGRKRSSIVANGAGTIRPIDPQAVITLGGASFPENDAAADGVGKEDICFSADPLKQALLKETVENKKYVKLALSINQAILRCMGDYPSKRDWKEHATAIIEEAIETSDLRDELYCQIVKQLINNRRRESCEKGWWLLTLCLGCFAPSTALAPYLRQFLLQTATQSPVYKEHALLCEARMERTRQNGPRTQPPINVEFEAVTSKILVAIKVYFPDQSSRSFAVDPSMLASELLRKIIRKLDSDADRFQGCALYLVSDTYEICIPNKAHLFDAMAEAALTPQSCKVYFRKKIWLGKEDTTSDALNNLLYHQFLPKYLRGLLVCPVANIDENLQEVAFLGALQYKASGDDQRRNNNFGELFKTYIPEHVYHLKTKEEWTKTILSAYTSLLNDKSPAQAKAIFIDVVRKWPFYGSSFFLVKQNFEPSMPESLIMAVNVRGIFIMDTETKATLMTITIGEIASWTFGPKHFSIKVQDLQSGDKFIFHTTSGEEITDLLEDYIQSLVEARKKQLSASSRK